MHYTKELTVTANTLIGAPVSTTIDLPAGVLDKIEITFPPGCARLVLAQIFDGATMLYPKTAGMSYSYDAYTVTINDFVIWDAAKTLTLKAWSPGTTYQHKLIFNFYVRSQEEIAMSRSAYY